MKKYFHFFFLCIVISPFYRIDAFSQRFIPDPGLPLDEEMTMKCCPTDTEAEAYVISDIGSSKFIDNEAGSFDVCFNRKTRIKIFKKEGFRYGEVLIPIYHQGQKFERVTSIKGTTINIENGIPEYTPLDLKTVYTEKFSDLWSLVKFALPKVKEGSVIEYSYQLETPYKVNLPDWNFQWEVPVRYSEYKVGMVPFYEYVFILKGVKKCDFQSSEENFDGPEHHFSTITYRDMVHTFVMKNVPAFKDESFITTINDYLIKIAFQLAVFHHKEGYDEQFMTTWPDLCNDFLNDDCFGRYIKSAKSASEEALSGLFIEGKPDMDKCDAIVSYIKANFRWNGIVSDMADVTPKQLIKEKKGNSASINLFLLSTLRQAGIEAYPVLLSTRDHGKVCKQYPFQYFFNYVLVDAEVNGNHMLLDGTDPRLSSFEVPPPCMNDEGLVVKKEEVSWIPLASIVPSVIEEKIDLALNPAESTAITDLQLQASDYDAYTLLGKYAMDTNLVYKEYEKKNYQDINSIQISKKDSFQLSLKGKVPIDKAGSLIFIQPFLTEPISKNPLVLSNRTYPVDFTYPFTRSYISNIAVPKGYTVHNLPKALDYNTKTYFVHYEASFSDGVLHVKGAYTFKKAVYDPIEYQAIRFVFKEIVEIMNQKIVVEPV